MEIFYSEYVYRKVLPIKEIANDYLFDNTVLGTSAFFPRWEKRPKVQRERDVQLVAKRPPIDLLDDPDVEPVLEERVTENPIVELWEGPVVDVVDINSLYVPPDAGTGLQYPTTRYYFTESFLTIDDVLYRRDVLGYDVSEELLAQFQEEPISEEERLKREKMGVGEGASVETVRMLEINMKWPLAGEYVVISSDGSTERVKQSGSEDDPYTEDVVINYWWDTKEVARVVPLGRISPTGDRACIDGRHSRIPRFFYGMGIMAKMRMFNEAMNSFANQMVDYGTLQNLPFYMYEPVSTGLLPEQFPLEPGVGVPVSNVRGVQFPRFGGDPGFFLQAMNMVQQWSERDGGVNDPVLGRQSNLPNAPRTARQHMANLQQSNIAFARQVAMLVEPFVDLFRSIHQHYVRYMPEEVAFTYFNRETKIFEEKTVYRKYFQNTDVDFDFIVNPNRQAEQQNAMTLVNMMAPILMQMNPDGVRELYKDLFRSMGKKNFDEIWPEMLPPQMGMGGGPQGMVPQQQQPQMPQMGGGM
jgi:hypothetical protein